MRIFIFVINIITTISLVGCNSKYPVTEKISESQLKTLYKKDNSIINTIRFIKNKNKRYGTDDLYKVQFDELDYWRFHLFYKKVSNENLQLSLKNKGKYRYNFIFEKQLEPYKERIKSDIKLFRKNIQSLDPNKLAKIDIHRNTFSSKNRLFFEIVPIKGLISKIKFEVEIMPSILLGMKQKYTFFYDDYVLEKTIFSVKRPQNININFLDASDFNISIISAISYGKLYSLEKIKNKFPYYYEIFKNQPIKLDNKSYLEILNKKYKLSIESEYLFIQNYKTKYFRSLDSLSLEFYHYNNKNKFFDPEIEIRVIPMD